MAVKKHERIPENNIAVLSHHLDKTKAYALSPSELIAWCKSIVVLLSKIEIPTEQSERVLFYMQVKQVEEYLKKIVNDIEESSQYKLLLSLLKQLYDILSNAGPMTCPAASIVLNLSPVMNVGVPRFVSAIASNEDSGSMVGTSVEKDVHLRRALTTLCRWLCYWDGTPSLHQCIISFIKALEDQKKFDVLLDVSVDVIVELFNALQFSNVRTVVIHVFLHILASTRDSIDTFDVISHNVPVVLENLAGDTSPDSRSILQNLIEAFTALLDLHPTHRSKYTEIVKCLDCHIKSNNCYILVKKVWKKRAMKERTTTKVKSQKVGLLNLGNTCYMNSALQALVMTKQFSNEILLSKLTFPLISKMKSFFALMLFSDVTFLNPEEFSKLCNPVNFARGTQQDSSEYICYLLDKLHEYETITFSFKANISESSKVQEIFEGEENLERANKFSSETPVREPLTILDKTPVPISSCEAKSDDGGRKRNTGVMETAIEAKRRCLRTEQNSSNPDSTLSKTIVQKVFAGVMSTTTRCLKCDFISIKKDSFWDLQLSFPDEADLSGGYSIAQLLEYYCSPENLIGDNQYDCPCCQSLQDAQRAISIDSAPKTLIVVLKQFFYDPKQRVREKLFHNVKLDKQISIMEKTSKQTYELYAVIIHSGSNLDNGHYYTIAKEEPDDWYIYNDAEVQSTSENALHSLPAVCTPYIVFYRNVTNSNEDSVQKLPDTSEDKSNLGSKSDDNIFEGNSVEVFNSANRTIPFSYLPSCLVELIKKHSVTQQPKRITRQKRLTPISKFDDNQPGSSTQ